MKRQRLAYDVAPPTRMAPPTVWALLPVKSQLVKLALAPAGKGGRHVRGVD